MHSKQRQRQRQRKWQLQINTQRKLQKRNISFYCIVFGGLHGGAQHWVAFNLCMQLQQSQSVIFYNFFFFYNFVYFSVCCVPSTSHSNFFLLSLYPPNPIQKINDCHRKIFSCPRPKNEFSFFVVKKCTHHIGTYNFVHEPDTFSLLFRFDFLFRFGFFLFARIFFIL